MTPDVLVDIYQCNIAHLDDPRIQASNPGLRYVSSAAVLPELSRAVQASYISCMPLRACTWQFSSFITAAGAGS